MTAEQRIPIPPGLAPTTPQIEYVRGLQRQLHLPNALLRNHCIARFGKPFAELDRAECSALIDELKVGQGLTAQLQREMGQRDLLGFGAS